MQRGMVGDECYVESMDDQHEGLTWFWIQALTDQLLVIKFLVSGEGSCARGLSLFRQHQMILWP